MKKILQFFGAAIIGICSCLVTTNASALYISADYYIDLTNLNYSIFQGTSAPIVEYKTLDSFLSAKNAGKLPEIYITDFLFDGVGAVKSPDLDDFIEAGSNDTKIKTLEIKVININTVSRVEFSGKNTGFMIGVDTNDKSGNIDIILNGVDLDTDSKKAPAIYVYNKDRNYTDCKVTIKTAEGSKNYIEGGKFKKVSLLDAENLDQYVSNYSGENLSNYNTYTKYYGIYTASQIENILFATVTADSEDLSEGDPLYFYKGSGAISSDIDLYFEGEGYLEVTSKNKEGIETKGNLTFDGGLGDYAIYAQDDCLNTTTANSAGATVRNAMYINVNSLLAVVSEDGDEGDAIDSNGTLEIAGGTIYAFAHPSSQDSGIDSDGGTTIKDATVIATGNMADAVSADQEKIFVQFNEKVAAGTLLVAKDDSSKVIVAFEAQNDATVLLYTSPDLEADSYKWYSGGEIEGEQENGLYTSVASYTGGTEISYRAVNDEMRRDLDATKSSRSRVLLIVWLCEIGALGLVLLGVWLGKRSERKK